MNMRGCESTDQVRKGKALTASPRHRRVIPVGSSAVTVRGCRIGQTCQSGRSGCRRGWEFDPREASVPVARHCVGAQARRWGFAEAGETAELLVSEVVANAVEQSSEPIQVRLSGAEGVLRLEVEERDAVATVPGARREVVPQASLPDTDAESGRGLFLVETLSREWGVDYTATGKVVWCEVVAGSDAADALV